MPEKVILEYKRVNVDKSTGRIVRVTDIGEDVLHTFESIEFRPMVRMYAESLQQCEDAAAVWKRTDRAGLAPYDLDAKLTRLLRTDPEAAIESLSPASTNPSTTMKRVQQEKQQARVAVSIRAGHDILADAFGDNVYSRSRKRDDVLYAECPCCGLWTPVGLGTPTSSFIGTEAKVGWILCPNSKCAASARVMGLEITNGKWVAFKVLDLLAVQSTRFYLPRAWNDGRPWVSREDLETKYSEYVKEKETRS